MELFKLNSANFKEIIEAHDVPVLVDFWATWCPPCQRQAPILEEVALSLGVMAIVAKLNVDESPDVAIRYGVANIPTMVIFKDGKEVDRIVGLTPANVLIQKIEAVE